MWHSTQKYFRWLPGAALGLYGARLVHEWLAVGNLALIVSTTVVFTLLTAVTLRRFSLAQTWPGLLLLGYVFYPEASPVAAVFVAAVAGVTWAQQLYGRCHHTPSLFHHITLILIGIAFPILYILTLAPDILPADNGEFQLIAAQLGVAHPPGFPLYTLLGYLMTRLPLGASPAYQVNLLSAITSSATLLLVYLSVVRLSQRPLAGVTAVFALGTATTFWAQATTANIRSLTGFFAAAMFYTLIGYAQKRRAQSENNTADRWLIWFALAAGLGLTHHLSLLFITLVAILFILLVDWTILQQPRRWLRPSLAAMVGLIPLLYLPLRAHADVRGASPELATLSGFLYHILARGFRGDFFYLSTAAELWERFKVMGNVLTFQFQPWLLVGMGFGMVWLLWRDRRLAFLLGGSFAIHTFITATYRAPQTIEYMLPAYVALALLLGCAAGSFQPKAAQAQRLLSLLMALLLVTAVYQGSQHYPSYASLHTDTNARDYAQSILADAPPGSVILADWHWVTPLWYLQEIEQQRPDALIQYVYPQADLYAETWAQRIAAELANGRAVIATHYDAAAYHQLPPPEPLGEAFLFRQEPRTTLPANFTILNVTLGSAIQLSGYQLDTTAVAVGHEAILTLAWQPTTDLPTATSLFAHLVNDNNQIIGQEDVPAQPQPAGITLTQFRLVPRPGASRLGAMPGVITIHVGAYASEPLLNESGDPRTSIATLTLLPLSAPPFTQNRVQRPIIGAAQTLIGYDWDTTLPGQNRLYLHWQTPTGYVTEIRDNLTPDQLDLPPYKGVWGITHTQWNLRSGWLNSQYVPFAQGIVWTGGLLPQLQSPLSLTQQLHSSRPLTRDLVISARLIGYQADGFHWAWTAQDDSIPALGAIPTLKWIANSQVYSPHRLAIPDTAQPGQTIGATLRLYDAFTNRPVPILDERITNQFPWLPLGQRPLPVTGKQ